jgi:hypothetical protein
MTTTAEDLKQVVRDRVLFITGDCSTFLHVKRCKNDLIGDWGSGGGNLLMATGLFALLNLLAKIHEHLVRPDSFVSSEDVTKVETTKSDIKTRLPEYKKALAKWRTPKVGEVNELNAFVRFATACQENGFDLGLRSTGDAEEVWRNFRNPLAHLAWVRDGTIASRAWMPDTSWDDAKKDVRSSFPPFFKNIKGQWVCYSDRLNLDAIDIAGWLCNYVDTCPEARIQATLDWVRSQEFETPIIAKKPPSLPNGTKT